MNSPSTRRVLSLIWFPFFFVGAFSLILVAAYANPVPHDLQVHAVASEAQSARLQTFAGYRSLLGLHVPLGVFVILLATALAVWAWWRR